MKVRLKQCGVQFKKVKEASFNSMKVRLKHEFEAGKAVGVPSFNSMKVRLKLFANHNTAARVLVSIP